MRTKKILVFVAAIALAIGCIQPFLGGVAKAERYNETNGTLSIPVNGAVSYPGGAQIFNTADGGYRLSNCGVEDFVPYEINIATAGTYDVTLYIDYKDEDGYGFNLFIDSINSSPTFFRAYGNGVWEDFKPSTQAINLTAGNHTIYVQSPEGWVSLGKQIEFVLQGGAGNGGSTTPIEIPVDSYDKLNEERDPGDGINLLTYDGGKYLADADAGESIEYKVNIPTAGTYEVSVLLGRMGENEPEAVGYDLYVGSSQTPVSFTTTGTGGWENFVAFTQDVDFAAGENVLKFVSIAGWCNISDISLVLKSSGPVESNACDVTAVTVPEGAEIDGINITGSVGNEDDNVQVGVAVSAGASWALYSDADCRNPLAGNVMPLEVGENTAYLRVIAEDTTTSKVYTVTITRAAGQGDDNGPGNDENNGGNQDDNNNLDNDENNNENKPIDKFGQSTSAPYILAVLGALVAGAVVTLSIFKKKEA